MAAATETPVWLTLAEVAERWRMSQGGVRRMVAAGSAPPSCRVGKRRLWRLDDVLAWEEARLAADDRRRSAPLRDAVRAPA